MRRETAGGARPVVRGGAEVNECMGKVGVFNSVNIDVVIGNCSIVHSGGMGG